MEGGGTVTYNQHTIADEYEGPSSYPTGGFVIDLSKTYSSLNSIDLVVKKGSRGNLPSVQYEIAYNSPSAGKATVKLMRKRFDRTSTVGNITGQPAGVTIQAASGVSSGAPNVSHTHSVAHDHGSFTSEGPTNSGGVVELNAVGPNVLSHTHTIDIPNLTQTSTSESTHTHVDNSIYQHSHSITQTVTNYTSVELSNATNLSTTVWYVAATGVKL